MTTSLPVIAIIGRPNVGKSSLFNCLTGSRDALVGDMPGLTRDRHYGQLRLGNVTAILIDTGGLEDDSAAAAARSLDVPASARKHIRRPTSSDAPQELPPLSMLMAQQTELAIREADIVLFVVDAKDGITHIDQRIAEDLRRTGKTVQLVVNKIDSLEYEAAIAEFHSVGWGLPCGVAAAHGRGIHVLKDVICTYLPKKEEGDEEAAAEILPGVKVAIAGRPNVGKSTLLNRMLGEDRVVVFDSPGTTRDSIFVPFPCQAGTLQTMFRSK